MHHLLAGGKLAVSHIQEVGIAQQREQTIPGGDVCLIVGGVAVREPVGERHRAITGDGQDRDQLLEIWPMLL